MNGTAIHAKNERVILGGGSVLLEIKDRGVGKKKVLGLRRRVALYSKEIVGNGAGRGGGVKRLVSRGREEPLGEKRKEFSDS